MGVGVNGACGCAVSHWVSSGVSGSREGVGVATGAFVTTMGGRD